MPSIPELLAAIPSIPWSTAFAMTGAIMTITFGIIQIVKTLRHRFPKDFTDDIKSVRSDMKSMDRTIVDLHKQVHAKTVTLDTLVKQVDELKSTNGQFNAKLEKLTDLIIKYLSDQR